MRHDPYDDIRQRLDDWGDIRRDRMIYLGYGVHDLDVDAEIPRGVQHRNDVHSDPVFCEIMRLESEYRRALTTDTAVRDLRPVRLRRLIMGRHVAYTECSHRELARRIGMDHRIVGNNLTIAYDILIESVSALDRQRFGDVLKSRENAGVAPCPTMG